MSRFDELWEGYLGDRLNEQELRELLTLMKNEEDSILSSIETLLKDKSYTDLSRKEQEERIYQKILAKTRESGKLVSFSRWRNIAAAAVVLLAISLAVFFITKSNRDESSNIALQDKRPANDEILPGGDKAILILADGRKIVLDTAENGELVQQGGIRVIKIGGQLSYDHQSASSEVFYNTITTPRGGQYQLELADGSKVWLNAASSITFPTAFNGNERVVELKGEGYFEVTHDPAKPFIVRVNDMNVTVLGTHFNINSYTDEPSIKTTLLEGRVKVQKNKENVFLNPGQQSNVFEGKDNILVKYQVDTEEVIAWKNGRFHFNSAGLESILRQAARWYDVEIDYKNRLDQTFSGALPRSENITELLKILEATGKVEFEINGRQVIVRSKP